MAYGLRYYKEIPQQDGAVLRLEIYRKDVSSVATEIGAVLRTLALDIQGQQDDIDAPIVKTSLTMSFVDASDLENGKKNGFWEEFYTPDAVLWKVILKAKNAKETAFREVWGGYVTPDSFSESLTYRGDVTIIARDNIGHMQDFPFDAEGDADGMISLYDLVNAGWSKIESPMQLDWAAANMWLQTDGVSAVDTLMNVSAFADKNWYEAVESALYSYGAVLRYVGENIVHICPLRYLPNQGYSSVDLLGHIEPVFSAGAERELIPAAKRIEERVEYELESLVFEKLPNSAFTGDTERFLIEGNSVDKNGIAYSISKKTSGSGWCCPSNSMFFNASQYEFYNGEDADKDYNFLVCNEYGEEGLFTNGRYAEYSRNFYGKNVLFEMRFGQPYAFTIAGQLRQYYSLENVTIAVLAEKNGVTSFLQEDGTWATDSAAIVLPADNLSLAIPISEFNGGVLLKVQIHHIKTTGAAKSSANYIPLYSASLSPLDAMRQSNEVNSNYNEGNNVILNRDPMLAPAFDKVALPAFIKNGIFYRSGDAILPASSWSWSGGIPQQMAVYNHLQVLAYYAKPFNLISGTIHNADLTNVAAIYVWKGAEHILLSGRCNFLTGQIEGAMLREFYRYDDIWGNMAGTTPAVDEGSESNVEQGAATAANTSTYTATQSVNIGTGGGGGGVGASNLNDLNDVNTDGVVAKSVLYYNGTEWVDRSLESLLTDYAKKAEVTEQIDPVNAWYNTLKGILVADGGNVKVKSNLVVVGDAISTGQGQNTQVRGVLNDLEDVTLASQVRGDLLMYNGAQWVNTPQSSIVPNLTGYATQEWVLGKNYLAGITSAMVTNALGYTPANNASLADYLPLAGGTLTGNIRIDSAASDIYFAVRQSGTSKAAFGWSSADGAYLYSYECFRTLGILADGTPYYGSTSARHTLLHSGNVGSYKAGGLAHSNGTVGAVVNSSGNVGIGTSSPEYKLHVIGNTFISGFTIAAKFFTKENYGLWRGNSYSTLLADTDVVYNATKHILAGGNVLIGTTTDSGYKLDVNGSMNLTAKGDNAEVLRLSTERAWAFYQVGSGAGAGLQLRTLSSGKAFSIGRDDASIVFTINTAASGATIVSDATIYPLASDTHRLGTINYRWSNVYSVNGNFSGAVTMGSTLSVGGASTFNGAVSVLGTNLVVSATGNVGIGTSSPEYKLHVIGNTFISGFTIAAKFFTKENYGLWRGNSYSTLLADTDVVYNATKHILAGGNVLIGATEDNGSGAKLYVNGGAYIGGGLSIKNSSGLYFNNTAGSGVLAAYVNSANKLIFGAGAKEKGYKTEIYGGDIDISSSTEISLIAGGGEAITINSSAIGLHKSAIFDDTATINGSVTMSSTLTVSGAVTINNNLLVTGEVASASDMRLKGIIEERILNVDDIANAPYFSFRWNDGRDDLLHLGTSAQYWEKIAAEYVSEGECKTLNYASLGVGIGISLAKKIKELEKEIKRLKGE